MFSGVTAPELGITGKEKQNHIMLLGLCLVPQAGVVFTGEKELTFNSPDETPAGFISHYTVALKCQADAHGFTAVGLLLQKTLLHKCIYFNENTRSIEEFVLKPREIQKLI